MNFSRQFLPVGALLASVFAMDTIHAQPAPNDPRAVTILDRAITKMGGEQALRDIKTIRMDVMTQWQRTVLTDHPFNDMPSYERHADLRDYTTASWRNTREFSSGASRVDIVRDSIASFTNIRANAAPVTSALNVAYRDERRELFAFAPERMLLVARDAGGLRMLPDTTIAGVPHARMATTVDGYPATYFIRRTDGLPAMVRFRADEVNDFGLAPWGMMEVEIWFSAWTRYAPGVLLPRQRDVRRVGRPYKRMTVQTAVINAPAPADSFVIADATVAAFYATQNVPMWDVPLDSVKIVADHFVAFPPITGSSGAVRIGGQWVLFETGQAGGSAARLTAWLARQTPASPVAAGIVSYASTSNGGARWFAEHQRPLFAPLGAAPMLRIITGKQTLPPTVQLVSASRWIKVGTDSLWLEPIAVPDQAGVMAVYSPTHRWLYLAMNGAPIIADEQAALIARLRARGMPVEWLGSVRNIRAANSP